MTYQELIDQTFALWNKHRLKSEEIPDEDTTLIPLELLIHLLTVEISRNFRPLAYAYTVDALAAVVKNELLSISASVVESPSREVH